MADTTTTVIVDDAVLGRLRQAFGESLQVTVESPDTDLLDSGILDSLSLVTVMAELEQAFGIDLLQQDFEIEDFRTLRRMAGFIAARRGALSAEAR